MAAASIQNRLDSQELGPGDVPGVCSERILPFLPGNMPATTAEQLTTCTIAMRFEADNVTQALRLMRSVIEPIRAKPGCYSCNLVQEVGHVETLRYTEKWTSEDAFRHHVQSPDFWPILLAIDLCCTEPQVEIGALALQGGLDLLLRLRSAPPLEALEPMEPLPEAQDGQG